MPVCFPLKMIALGAVVLLLPSLADAQIVSRTVGGGLHISAPFVNVDIPALDLLAVRNPEAGGRRFFGRRRAAIQLPAPQAGRRGATQHPTLQAPTAGVPELAPRIAEKANSLPTPEKLATMDAANLKATLQDVSNQLQNRLARLQSGTGWQRHLKVPSEVLFDPTQYTELVKKTLAKFDAVSGNPRYAKIAGMPSFIATGATLRQLVARTAESQMANSAVVSATPLQKQTVVEDEILPTPAEPEQPNATRGERSILKRASR